MIRVLSGNTYLLHKSATFAQFVANTVSHEIGHTFGLLDAYLSTGGIVTDTSPYDIMQLGSNAEEI